MKTNPKFAAGDCVQVVLPNRTVFSHRCIIVKDPEWDDGTKCFECSFDNYIGVAKVGWWYQLDVDPKGTLTFEDCLRPIPDAGDSFDTIMQELKKPVGDLIDA